MNERQAVNFFGGSQSGKSVCLFGLYAELGFLGYRADLNLAETDTLFTLLEWHPFNAISQEILMMHEKTIKEGINIFLLRSLMTSNVDKGEIERDSVILNNLNYMKVEIYTMTPNRDVPHNIIKIMERKGWLDNK